MHGQCPVESVLEQCSKRSGRRDPTVLFPKRGAALSNKESHSDSVLVAEGPVDIDEKTKRQSGQNSLDAQTLF